MRYFAARQNEFLTDRMACKLAGSNLLAFFGLIVD